MVSDDCDEKNRMMKMTMMTIIMMPFDAHISIPVKDDIVVEN